MPQWLSRGAEPDPSTVIVLLGHHENNRLSFSQEAFVLSESFKKKFVPPSVAVLSACGSGGVGASEIIAKINEAGVESIVATSTDISGYMGAMYIDCLLQAVSKRSSSLTVGEAHREAASCVGALRQPGEHDVIGARALEFMLLGNPDVKICAAK